MRLYFYYLLMFFLLIACDTKGVKTPPSTTTERLIVIGQSTLEFMLEFGLTDKIIGIAQIDKQNSKYDSEISKLPIITKQWPSKEAILSLQPDLIFTMEAAFRGERIGSPDFWHQRNIATFQINDYTVEKSLSAYRQDLIQSGELFKKEKEVNLYLEKLDTVLQKIGQNNSRDKESPSILFLACVGPIYYYYPRSLCVIDEIIEDCGGLYVDLGERSIILSTEAIININPDKIIISQYMYSDANYAINKLYNNKLLRHIPAIHKKDILVIDYTNAVSGSLELPNIYQAVFSFISPNL